MVLASFERQEVSRVGLGSELALRSQVLLLRHNLNRANHRPDPDRETERGVEQRFNPERVDRCQLRNKLERATLHILNKLEIHFACCFLVLQVLGLKAREVLRNHRVGPFRWEGCKCEQQLVRTRHSRLQFTGPLFSVRFNWRSLACDYVSQCVAAVDLVGFPPLSKRVFVQLELDVYLFLVVVELLGRVGPEFSVVLLVLEGFQVMVDDCVLEAVREVTGGQPHTSESALAGLDFVVDVEHHLLLLKNAFIDFGAGIVWIQTFVSL